MQTNLPEEIRRRLVELARPNDEALARRLGISRVTLGRALAGLRVQRGTIALIERGAANLMREEK